MEGLIDREEMRKHPMMQPLFDENDERQICKMRESATLAMMAKENELVIAPIEAYPCTRYSVIAIDEITRAKGGKWERKNRNIKKE